MTGIQILIGDVRTKLGEIADGTIQTCVTSPPYWGLRDYGNDAQIGLEQSPEEYVKELVNVFREVKRVLRQDGTLWLNLGDSYSGSGKGPADLKPKDLIGIPWLVAFALQADGWYLRQDIIWAKPNPMPESVTDRCTKSHEYIFLLSKSRKYYYNSEAIQEPARVGYSSEEFIPSSYKDLADNKNIKSAAVGASSNNRSDEWKMTRNKRDVWTINTQPYKGAHFAVMPEALVKPCILAGSKVGDIVLDPFLGSGTVGLVALELHRKVIGIELNPEYAEIARKRTNCYQPIMEDLK